MRLIVEADGGSRGNPGPAGYGAVVKDAETGEVLAEVAESLGKTTNNVAEYNGLIAGLRAATEADASADVEVRMDSKLVVEQMRGNWQVKNADLRPLASKAAALARSLGSVSYDWIPREKNKHADRLANEAMDAATGRPAKKRPPVAADDETASDERPRRFLPASLGTPTRTLLLRHGATSASTDGWFNGSGDEPLTAAGREQVEAVAKALSTRAHPDAIVASPLRRAKDTADVVAATLGLDVRVENDLREVDFGSWEGMSMRDIATNVPDQLELVSTDTSAAPPDGESLADARRRAERVRSKLLARYPGKTVLVVAHGLLISVLVSIALDVPVETAYRMRIDTTGLVAVDWYPDGFAQLHSFNDIAHL